MSAPNIRSECVVEVQGWNRPDPDKHHQVKLDGIPVGPVMRKEEARLVANWPERSWDELEARR